VVPLPEAHRKLTLGRLVIRSVAPDAGGECVNITFDPLVLPKGVEPSNDPLIAARAAPYALGLICRLGEGTKQYAARGRLSCPPSRCPWHP
jgi:catalase